MVVFPFIKTLKHLRTHKAKFLKVRMLRQRHKDKDAIEIVKSFDAFPKIQEDFQEISSTRGTSKKKKKKFWNKLISFKISFKSFNTNIHIDKCTCRV